MINRERASLEVGSEPPPSLPPPPALGFSLCFLCGAFCCIPACGDPFSTDVFFVPSLILFTLPSSPSVGLESCCWTLFSTLLKSFSCMSAVRSVLFVFGITRSALKESCVGELLVEGFGLILPWLWTFCLDCRTCKNNLM